MIEFNIDEFLEGFGMLMRNFNIKVGSCISVNILIIEKKRISPSNSLLNSKPLSVAMRALEESRYFLMGSYYLSEKDVLCRQRLMLAHYNKILSLLINNNFYHQN